MARTWDVPGLLRAIPAPLLTAWVEYYAEEPWDAPAVAVAAFGKRGRGVSGDDAEGLEEAFRRFAGGA